MGARWDESGEAQACGEREVHGGTARGNGLDTQPRRQIKANCSEDGRGRRGWGGGQMRRWETAESPGGALWRLERFNIDTGRVEVDRVSVN